MLVALDANILLEILERRPKYKAVVGAMTRHSETGNVDFAVSVLTVSNLFYLAEKHKLPLSQVETLLSKHKLFDVLAIDVSHALQHYRQDDFEDALQVATATRENCTAFMTLDKKLAEKYGKYLNIQLIS